MHRNYASRFPAWIIITKDAITIENSNLAHGFGPLELHNFRPFTKNASIAIAFQEMGLTDEPSSGIRNTYKYTSLYAKTEPVFYEDHNIFSIVIPLPIESNSQVNGNIPKAIADHNSISNSIPRSVSKVPANARAN